MVGEGVGDWTKHHCFMNAAYIESLARDVEGELTMSFARCFSVSLGTGRAEYSGGGVVSFKEAVELSVDPDHESSYFGAVAGIPPTICIDMTGLSTAGERGLVTPGERTGAASDKPTKLSAKVSIARGVVLFDEV